LVKTTKDVFTCSQTENAKAVLAGTQTEKAVLGCLNHLLCLSRVPAEGEN